MGIIFGLAAAMSFAISFILLKKSFSDFPPSVAFFFAMILGLLLWIPFSFFIGFDIDHIREVFVYAILSAILSEAFIFYILSKGEISITGTIFASYPIYTILFSVLLLGERLLPMHWIFVIVTIMGTLLASLPKDITRDEIKKKAYIFWALAGATAVGLSDTISKGAIDRTSAAAFLFTLAIVQIPVSLIYLKLEKETAHHIFTFVKNLDKYKFAVMAALFNVIGLIGLWLAFENTYASIASPLTAAYPGIMVILAVIFLKEKPSKIELLGLGLIVIGVIGISAFY
ncbi:MAG: DMT family transporter [bacterium]|nr:DMT family transporter [bacterium]